MRMDWAKLLCAERLGVPEHATAKTSIRTEFDSDVDRVLFSGAFRRLSRKTQVHPMANNDHVHNRLTHSIEVARVGSALGHAVGNRIIGELPVGHTPRDVATIVHAACLAHDIGNPPFGHAGESAIKNWFLNDAPSALTNSSLDAQHKLDLYQYEGNAQGFRVVTQTENHLFEGGLRLTFATLATFLKYPWTVNVNAKKFSTYLSESSILTKVAEKSGLIPLAKNHWCRHPLAFLVEAADDICYGIVDLEDAVELKILTFDKVFDVLTSSLDSDRRVQIERSFTNRDSHRVNLSRLRAHLFDDLVGAAADGFMLAYGDIMNGGYEGNLFDRLSDKHSCKNLVSAAKELASVDVYRSSRKTEMELGCASTFECLLTTFCTAALRCSSYLKDPTRSSLDWKSELVLRLLGDHSPLFSASPPDDAWNEYQCTRRVLDFVGGMTDNYAVHVARQINGAS